MQERLYEGSWREPLGRFRSSFAFRGVADAAADLTTSLARLGGPFEQTEGHILRAFRKYARGSLAPDDSVWNWLALAQHHGLPTRLLDWTYSPYVALHFCTADIERFDRDGVVWCMDYLKAHDLLPEALKGLSDEEGADVFTAEMLDRAADCLAELDELGRDQPVRGVPRAAELRRAHREPVRAVLADEQPESPPAPVDGRPRRPVPPAGRPRRAEVGGPRQARPGQHHRARAAPGAGRVVQWLKRYYSPRL